MTDASNIFNLEHTSRIDGLCRVPKAQRDEAWRGEFLCYLPTASLASPEQQVLSGPDGFPYFILRLPEPDQSFTTFSVAHILEYVTDNGFGIVINPGDGGSEPDWVFTFGDLWNYRETKEFVPASPRWLNESKVDASGPVNAERSILVGSPSDDILPPYVRQVMAKVLNSRFRMEAPSVFLMEDEALNPSLNLVFNVFQEDFPDDHEFDFVRTFLSWSVPRDYGLIGIPKSSELAKNFQPLVE